ncbi:MAG: radical SAM protein [Sulfurimonadaceae bacterium]|jgi:wyosine [tRNA(Phe)-imidazoG37] synthetase (radical SAM superfamily)|nr:radical SAM protein [Sulfurimonadaceae bacterium]
MHTIFGPINSRRFGVSLGIDLSPFNKQCDFDCLYCELAPMLAMEKQTEIVSVNTIMEELKTHLNDTIDVITITANGEPTLYPHLPELIDEINKIKNNTQTLILSNSASLRKKEVFDALLKLDQVKLSLDAVSPDIFKKIDRPHPSISIDAIIESIINFSKVFTGKLFIEILFVLGVNDSKEEVEKLNKVLHQINATRIDIGTIDRPPAYDVKALSHKELHDISLLFDPVLPIHIVQRKTEKPSHNSYDEEEILNTLDKRALTRDDIELLFDMPSKERLEKLIKEKKVLTKIISNVEFLVPHTHIARKRAK